ncbi:tripartite tricarboxylate transporter substrate binding protein [Roseomonas sp. ACRSG]|nr:tripartite tricarboxylate transporter substrate binding protein [Roseomonas sp. ACRSG]
MSAPRLTRRGAALLLAGAPALLARPALVRAATSSRPAWPADRPVRVIVPLAAGGTADFLARHLASRLQELTGQSFVVENRTGGGGAVGWQAVARAAPDATTVLLTDNSLAIAAAAGRDVGFDPRQDLEPVSLLAQYPPLLTAAPSLPVQDLKGFLAYAKARPGQLFYGSGGIGSVPHLQAELLQEAAGIRLNHVSYRGMAQAVTDLIGGQVQFILPVYPTVAGQLRGGALKPMAVGAAERLPALPDLPTAREQGLDFVHHAWFGLLAPRGTPQEALAGMQAVMASAMSGQDFGRRLEETGATVPGAETAAFREAMASEIALWSRVLREHNIKVE